MTGHITITKIIRGAIIKKKKIRAAQYFYDTLNDENCDFILPAFTSPTIENIQEAIHIVIEKTQEARYRTMLEGCHIQELFEKT